MNIFSVITLLGGLAMFLYGMRLMGNNLKESSSGTLKTIMEKVTNNLFKAFLLGVFVTALIQSSTATIVITAGLVAAGIISLRQSLGIIVGANVGTTVTGQIIRLLDVNETATAWLQVFKPSTLAPIALILGIVLIMFCKFKKSDIAGNIAIGFGILFSGLLNMTSAVSSLSESEAFLKLLTNVNGSPLLGYVSGAGVAFILQSSSATIGILQAFSVTGQLTFKGIYAVLVGIYLGDCVTTAIVCSIGAKAEAKRVGIVNILFNLSETILVLIVVTVVQKLGLLNSIWNAPLSSGGIANTNTVFNLGCAILLLPIVKVYEKLSRKLVKDEEAPVSKYADKLEALNPNFYNTPALALNSAYQALLSMFDASRENVGKAFDLLAEFDPDVMAEIHAEEKNIDLFADRISNYLVNLSPHIHSEMHNAILNQYYKVISEFERMGDHAENIAEAAEELSNGNISFSKPALREMDVLRMLIESILDSTRLAFLKRNEEAALRIEPMEEVVDDIINALRDNHLERLSNGECNVLIDNVFLNLLVDVERVSDVCSNIGVAVITRIHPELKNKAHSYISELHQGQDETFNKIYTETHTHYFNMFERAQD